MTLRLYDSLSRRVERIAAVGGAPLRIYSCGPTVYGRIHVGNARPFVLAMTLRRFLVSEGVQVRLVINITDVNDKIYAAAKTLGVRSDALADRMTRAYIDDTDRLGLGRPDVEPRATETMDAIIDLIRRLIDDGAAYAGEDDVYFRVERFPTYGALSGQRPDQLLADGRIEAGPGKKSALDFALWKARKGDEDTWWPSPWGDGRPGWHVECSAMATAHLGEEIDIHGGGLDLIFPHHENERAQSESASGQRFSRTWMHNGMLRLAGDKMSKSLGNIESLADLLDRHQTETVLYMFASAHYRSPLDYSDSTLEQARQATRRLRDCLLQLRRVAAIGSRPGDEELQSATTEATQRFRAALSDDFRTPEALAALFELVAVANRALRDSLVSAAAATSTADQLARALDVLGLSGLDREGSVPAEIRRLVLERDQARAEGRFDVADGLRNEIERLGWLVRDRAEGSEITKA